MNIVDYAIVGVVFVVVVFACGMYFHKKVNAKLDEMRGEAITDVASVHAALNNQVSAVVDKIDTLKP